MERLLRQERDDGPGEERLGDPRVRPPGRDESLGPEPERSGQRRARRGLQPRARGLGSARVPPRGGVLDGRTCHLRDSRGLQHLVELLRRPGQPVAALSLTRAAEQGEPLAIADEDHGARVPRASENARVGVTRAIGAALRRIEEHHPSLGAHLRATVRTGQRCVYTPDPCVPVAWQT